VLVGDGDEFQVRAADRDERVLRAECRVAPTRGRPQAEPLLERCGRHLEIRHHEDDVVEGELHLFILLPSPGLRRAVIARGTAISG